MVFMRFLVLLGLLPVGAAFASNEVMELQGKVAEAEKKLDVIQDRIGAARKRYKAADTELQDSVRALVRVGQYPPGFWLARSVVMDSPSQAELVRVVGSQQSAKLAQAQAEASQLAELYGAANRQLAAVREIQQTYGDARGLLHEAEKRVLRRAGIQADSLSEDLQAALDSKVVVANLRKAPVLDAASAGGLPVAGRVERGFGQGEGSAKAGVVLKAVAGAEVRATQPARVMFAGPFRHFGGLVIVKTVSGEDVLLGGLGTLAVNAGDDVAAGQVLGGVGDEGRIYWEVRKRGRVVNPL